LESTGYLIAKHFQTMLPDHRLSPEMAPPLSLSEIRLYELDVSMPIGHHIDLGYNASPMAQDMMSTLLHKNRWSKEVSREEIWGVESFKKQRRFPLKTLGYPLK